MLQRIRNGRTGSNARTRLVQVETKPPKKKRISFVPNDKNDKAETPPLTIERTAHDGSSGERVGFTLNRNVSHSEQDKIETAIRNHECYEDVFEIRWRNRKTLVIEVKRSCLCDLAQVDVQVMMKEIIRNFPIHIA